MSDSLPYPVYSKKDGVVLEVRWDDALGKIVSLEFMVRRFGLRRTYKAVHTYMDSVSVRPGAVVRRGTVLGFRKMQAQPVSVFNRRGRSVKPIVYKGD